jgi:hypothetical protein
MPKNIFVHKLFLLNPHKDEGSHNIREYKLIIDSMYANLHYNDDNLISHRFFFSALFISIQLGCCWWQKIKDGGIIVCGGVKSYY